MTGYAVTPPDPSPASSQPDRVVRLIAAVFALLAGTLGVLAGIWHFASVYNNYWDGAALADQLTTIAVYGLTIAGGAACVALGLTLLRPARSALTLAALAAAAGLVAQGALIGTNFDASGVVSGAQNLVAIAASIAALGAIALALLAIHSAASARADEHQSGPRPAGWYLDPGQPSQLRWWDGARWTAHVHSR